MICNLRSSELPEALCSRLSSRRGRLTLILSETATLSWYSGIQQQIMSANADQINEQNGAFPLLMASQIGHTECVQALLEKGADVNQTNERHGTFPLLMASQNGHTKCVDPVWIPAVG